KSLDLPVDDDGDNIKNRSFKPQRQTHRHNKPPALRSKFEQGGKSPLPDFGGKKHVLAAVTAQSQFRQAEPAHPVFLRLSHRRDGTTGVTRPVERSLIQGGGPGNDAVHKQWVRAIVSFKIRTGATRSFRRGKGCPSYRFGLSV